MPSLQNPQKRRRLWPAAVLVLFCAIFCALGTWQVKRLAWKEALIARVHAGLIGVPADAADLGHDVPAGAEYRKLSVMGTFAPKATVLVDASTMLGHGYWAMAPLYPADSRSPATPAAIWINRGFVPAGSSVAAVARSTPAGVVTLTGLLRHSEPHGSWLRTNRPAEDRWYSRDIAAIAAHKNIGNSETGWFIDQGVPKGDVSIGEEDGAIPAEHTPAPTATITPVPGLTMIRFPNNHLSYAITWFLMAALSLVGVAVVWRQGGAAA